MTEVPVARMPLALDRLADNQGRATSSLRRWMQMVDAVVRRTVTLQDSDADLDAIAAISPTNDDVIQRKAGAWTNRTMAQLWADLVPTKTVGTAGSAAGKTGQMIYVTDETGGAVHAFSDGTDWRRVTDRAVIA